jgi:prephenate dehydrogenase
MNFPLQVFHYHYIGYFYLIHPLAGGHPLEYLMNKKIKIGIIGRGQFTNFIVPYLEKYFDVFTFGREEKSEEILKSLDYLVFSVPLQNIEEVCQEIQNKVSEHTVIVDVTSVKVEPLRILKQYFLKTSLE